MDWVDKSMRLLIISFVYLTRDISDRNAFYDFFFFDYAAHGYSTDPVFSSAAHQKEKPCFVSN